jgi:hypothetical protein
MGPLDAALSVGAEWKTLTGKLPEFEATEEDL